MTTPLVTCGGASLGSLVTMKSNNDRPARHMTETPVQKRRHDSFHDFQRLQGVTMRRAVTQSDIIGYRKLGQRRQAPFSSTSTPKTIERESNK